MKEYTFNVRLLPDGDNTFKGHYEVEIDLPDRPFVRCEFGASLDALAEVVKHTLGDAERTFVAYIPRNRVVNHLYIDKNTIGQFKARVYSASDFAELDKRLTSLEERHEELLKEVRLLEQ